jgi:hypothetical protein
MWAIFDRFSRSVALTTFVLAIAANVDAQSAGTPVPAGTWTMAVTQGVPASSNGWEQTVYASGIKQSVMLSQYHQQNSEPNESIVGYNFDTNGWNVLDMGGLMHTENIGEGGESQGFFGYNPNNNTIFTTAARQGRTRLKMHFTRGGTTFWANRV